MKKSFVLNVGIGTNNPTETLSVYGPNAIMSVRSTTTNGQGFMEVMNNSGDAAGVMNYGSGHASAGHSTFYGDGTVHLMAGAAGTSSDILFETGTSAFTPGTQVRMKISSAGRVGVSTATPNTGSILDLFGTGTQYSSLVVPRETTALRPSGVNGMIRYNTTTQKFEVYEGLWQNMISSASGGSGDNLGNHTATQAIMALAGTSSAPSYTFAGNTGVGIWSPGAGKMAFTVGGIDTLRIDSGLVGIGEPAPNAKLDIKFDNGVGADGFNSLGAATLKMTRGAGNYSGLMLGYWVSAGNDVGGAIIPASGTNDIIFGSDNLHETMRITGAGRLAIGTTTATSGSILDLRGTGAGLSSLIVPRDTTAFRPAGVNGMIRYNTTTQKFEVYEGLWQNMLSTASGGGGDNLGNHTATVPLIGVVGTAGGPGYTFSGDTDTGLYHPAANIVALSTGTTERMRIDNLGNVGVGTNNPTFNVEVAGNVAAGDVGFKTRNTNSTGYSVYAMFTDSATHEGALFMNGTSQSGFGGVESVNLYNFVNGPMTFGTNAIERVRIASSGNVGINTVNPNSGAILDINGSGTSGSSMIVPRDTTAFRPAGVNGMIRYNTTTQKFEVYEGLWQNMLSTASGGGGDNLGNHTATVPLIGVVGTAGGPGYTFSGDTDTGVYHPTTNVLSLGTNGSERLRIAANGSIGIGTATNSGRLHIYDSAAGASTGLVVSTTVTSTGASTAMDLSMAGSAGSGNVTGINFNTVTPGSGNSFVGIKAGAITTSGGGNNNFIVTGNLTGGSSENYFANIGNLGGGAGAATAFAKLGTVSGSGANTYLITSGALSASSSGEAALIKVSDFDGGSGAYGIYIGGTPTSGAGSPLTLVHAASMASGGDAYGLNMGAVTASGTISAIRATSMASSTTDTIALNFGNMSAASGSTATALATGTLTGGSTAYGANFGNISSSSATGVSAVIKGGTVAGADNTSGITIGDISSTAVASTIYGVRLGNINNSGGSSTAYGYYMGTMQGTTKRPLWLAEPNGASYIGGILALGNASSTTGAVLELNGTGANSSLIVPRDTTALRPAGVNGMVRYNTNLAKFEVYAGGQWANVIAPQTSEWVQSTAFTTSSATLVDVTGATVTLPVSDGERLNFTISCKVMGTGTNNGHLEIIRTSGTSESGGLTWDAEGSTTALENGIHNSWIEITQASYTPVLWKYTIMAGATETLSFKLQLKRAAGTGTVGVDKCRMTLARD